MKKKCIVIIDLLAVLLLSACTLTPDAAAADAATSFKEAAAPSNPPVQTSSELETAPSSAQEAIPIPVVIAQRLEDVQERAEAYTP